MCLNILLSKDTVSIESIFISVLINIVSWLNNAFVRAYVQFSLLHSPNKASIQFHTCLI